MHPGCTSFLVTSAETQLRLEAVYCMVKMAQLESIPHHSTDFPANPEDKQGYLMEFSDPFEEPHLNQEKWLPYYLPQWSTRQKAAARYTLPGEGLRLHIEQDQQPWNPAFDGALRVSSLQTGCFAGPVGSPAGQHRFNPHLVVSEAQPTQQLYTPHYGYFETRLKAVPLPGYMVALWMIGFEERPEHSAEICICEIFGHQVSTRESTVGYGVHPFDDLHIRDEFYQDTLPINAAHYHIYAVDWTPTQLDFYVDNIKIRTLEQSPNYPMQFMLNIYELPHLLSPQSQPQQWPKTLEVDYVRGYRVARGEE